MEARIIALLMTYLISLLAAVEIYVLLVLSANLQWGTLGMITLSTAGFAGIGAYGALYVASFVQPPSLVPLCIGIVLPAILSPLVFLLLIRFKGIYLIAVSLAVQYCLENIFANWTAVTRGALGIAGARILLLGASYSGDTAILTITTVSFLLVAALANVFVYKGHYGLVLRCIREDEIATRSLGVRTRRLQLLAFVASSAVAGLAGVLLAAHLDFINPSVFDLGESLALLAGVMVGGRGSLAGSLIGASVLIFLPEVFRFVPLGIVDFADLRQILYGLVLLLFLVIRPKGIAPEFPFLRDSYVRS
jgi:branched-chain amino acid transport system permease protein